MQHPMGIWTFILAIVLVEIKASWLAESSNQYHIQTDEGPERYFRYQTNNGQYRKEKRLKDGTVIGTDAWIDASGLLRQKDYIADADGYRILKSRTLFVGQDQPIDNVLKNLKSFTNGVTPQKIQPIQPSVSSARARPSAVNNFIPATRPDWLYYDHPSPSPTSYHQTNSPSQRTFVSGRDDYARPTPAPTAAGYHFTKAIADDRVPSIRLEPPYKSVQPISIHSAPTVLPVASNLGTLSPSTPSPIASFTYSDTATSFLSPYPTNPSTLNTELLPPLVGPTQVSNEVDNRIDATETQNAFVSKNLEAEPQPLYTRPAAFRSSLGRNVPNGQEAGYDGAAINGNGFSYYLPRHYHEEVSDGARQAGSFGYIDPFGIRRVVYYDASPERGFLHKKNNRYVGFNATPYDPPPNE